MFMKICKTTCELPHFFFNRQDCANSVDPDETLLQDQTLLQEQSNQGLHEPRHEKTCLQGF